MAQHQVDNAVQIDVLLAPATVDADTESGSLDTSLLEDNTLLTVSVAGGGTGSVSFAVTESDTLAGSYTAVPTTALFNPDTAEDDTFDAATTTLSNQTLALDTRQVKRFIRIEITAGTSHDIAIFAASSRKYANFTQFSG